MKPRNVKRWLSIPVAFAAGLLVACGGTVAALSASDAARLAALEVIAAMLPNVQGQVTQLRTDLTAAQARITALANAPRAAVVLAPRSANVQAMTARLRESAGKAGGSSLASSGAANATLAGCNGLGNFLGRPDNANPISSGLVGGVSCTGFLYVVSDALTAAEQGFLQDLPDQSFFWTSTDCTGPRYVSRNYAYGQLSADVFLKGAAFMDRNTRTGEIVGYFMINPASPRVVVAPGSYRSSGYQCIVFPNGEPVPDSIQVQPNDEMISGVPSGPISGPITVSTTAPAP